MPEPTSKEITDKAVNLRLGGATYEQIAKQLGITQRSAQARVARSLNGRQADDPDVRALVELAQVDGAILAVTKLVRAGDVPSVKALVQLQEQRRNIVARHEARTRFGTESVREAVDAAIAQMTWLTPTDVAAQVSAQVAASAIDDLFRQGETGKAVYALPHVMNALSALGGTPERRRELGGGAGNESALGRFRERARHLRSVE